MGTQHQGSQVALFVAPRRMLTVLDSMAHDIDGAALCFEDRHGLALAHGMGHALAHSAFFYLWCALEYCNRETDTCWQLSLRTESELFMHFSFMPGAGGDT